MAGSTSKHDVSSFAMAYKACMVKRQFDINELVRQEMTTGYSGAKYAAVSAWSETARNNYNQITKRSTRGPDGPGHCVRAKNVFL